jgi:NADH-quinone oxidoreductase subunit N
MKIIINGLFENDLLCFLPEIFLISFILFLLLLALVINNNKFYNFPFMLKISSLLTIYGLLLTILLYLNNITFTYSIFLNQYISYNLIVFFKIFILSIAVSVIYLSLDYFELENIKSFEYIIICLLALIGMLLMISSNDFIFFYLSVELQSLALYLLAAYKKYSNFSTEAGLKYFILGAFSSGLLLFGISLIYGFTGIINFSELAFFLTDTEIYNDLSNLIIIGFLFFFVGLLFKLAAAPFHMWAPDVYQGAPTSVTLFFSVLPKTAVIIFLIRILHIIFLDLVYYIDKVLIYSAVLSLIIGICGAIYQIRIKRLLAYSAISHMGFILLGFIGNTYEGLFSVVFYLLSYIILNISIFGIVLSLRNRITGSLVRDIKDLIFLPKTNMPLAIMLTIVLFSIGGIPPLIGFFSKFFIFINLIALELYFVAILSIIFSVIGIIYYIRLIKLMFFNLSNINLIWYRSVSKINAFFIVITMLFNILFFLYPAPIVYMLENNLINLFLILIIS